MTAPSACRRCARCIVVTAPDPAFRDLGPEDLDLGGGPVSVYDFWRCCKERLGDHPGVLYYGFGLNPAEALVDEARMPAATGAAE